MRTASTRPFIARLRDSALVLLVPAFALALATSVVGAQQRPATSAAPAQTATPQPAELPMGAVADGALGARGEATKYRYAARSAGVLTVVANGVADLLIHVTDEDGQTLPEGRADRDLRGNMGSEMLAVILPRSGTFLVEVSANSAGGPVPFAISAAFSPMPAFERPADPDGRPGAARTIESGTAHEDALNPDAGDAADWYTMTAAEAMTLIVLTRVPEGEEGDFVLEAFIGGKYGDAAVRSDRDLQGVMGNESVSVDLKAGEMVHFRVSANGERGGEMKYRISITRAP